MLQSLLAAPVLVKVLGSLALILALKPLCRSLLAALLIGAVVLGFWSGRTVGGVLDVAAQTVFSLDNFMLMLVLAEVISLSSQMRETGLMRDLVAAVRARLPRRGAMAVLPAVIGLLPMPGGALFSAPLVDSCDTEGTIDPTLKAKTNYWFRHIWEYWWPLYPGVLVAMDQARLDVWHMMMTGLPISVVMALAGRWFLLRQIHAEADGTERPAHPDVHLAHLFAPIWVVVVVYAVVRLVAVGADQAFDGVGEVNKYGPMAVGILAAMLAVQRMRALPGAEWKKIVLSARVGKLILIVMAVRIYGAYIESGAGIGTSPADAMGVEMRDWNVPVMAIVMVLPFVAGLTTGLAVGFVGASFPVVMALVGGAQDADWAVRVAWVALAYGFGHVGMMLSPVHVCNIVTNEHFDTRLLHSTRGILLPCLAVLAAALALHLAYMWLLV